ncbi:MAG: PLP-dependent aminotransferase family protein [Clostridia bacterium]|nr:PLP-dependent aminotransferase family protein [Clostridia bacterium]
MEAAYLRLYRELKKQILSGAYSYGERFPSKRAAAGESGLSLITVQHAYEILCDEGWLTARERSGFFVAYHETGPLSLPFIPETPDVFPKEEEVDSGLPFETYSRLMRSTLAVWGEQVMEKSPNKGRPELREALAAYLAAQRSMPVSPAQIVIGSGAEYLYSVIVRMLGTDRPYALENPSYDAIRLAYQSLGAACRMLPMNAEGICSDALAATDAAVLHVTPFHSWPTGITAGASKRREYVSWAEKRGAYLVEDDFDSELSASSKAEDTLYSLSPERVIHINTFTRTVSPALRAGYMVLPFSLVSVYQEKAGYLSCSVPVTEQLFLTELLRTGEFVRHLRRIRRKKRAPKPIY